MAEARVLVVDDEVGMLEVIGDTLKKLPDTEVVLEPQSTRAVGRLRDENWDLLITDLRMPELGGVDLLRQAHRHDPHLDALIITAFPSVDTAVETMKLGAADYLTKPFLPDELLATVRRILDNRRLRQENLLLRRHLERAYSFGDMIGRSVAMRSVFEAIERLGETNVDVLILGETGTGKELVARSIHRNSRRKNEPFVPVDCGAIPEDLLESEFFGHERGAFTGAHQRSLGLMEFASGGTFFLDEIGDLSPNLQAKLLRALQERRIRRVGGAAEIDVDLRVVAATSRRLEEQIRHERFRSELFYRINVGRIELPPLRERRDDIPLLASHFVDLHAREMGRENVILDPNVLEVFSGYPWPGNVRELQNVIKRVLAMTRGEFITVEDLPDSLVAAAGDLPGGAQPGFFDLRDAHVAAFERTYLDGLLQAHEGDVTAAAAEAQIPRGTFYRLLNKHNLTAADYRTGTDTTASGSAH